MFIVTKQLFSHETVFSHELMSPRHKTTYMTTTLSKKHAPIFIVQRLSHVFNHKTDVSNSHEDKRLGWAHPGFEPATSRTPSENHTPRPTSCCIV